MDDRDIILQEIEKLKQQKDELIDFNEYALMFKEKQMKVCEVLCKVLKIMKKDYKLILKENYTLVTWKLDKN